MFYGQYLYKKYKSYKYHLTRIEEASQIPFLEKMSAEFKAHDERGEIDFGIMARGQAAALRDIIDNWPKYYVTQWRLKVNNEKKKADELLRENTSLQTQLKELYKEIDQCRRSRLDIERSEAYRTGMFVTYPARKVWGGLKCLRENGIKYTAKHIIGKFARILGFHDVKW